MLVALLYIREINRRVCKTKRKLSDRPCHPIQRSREMTLSGGRRLVALLRALVGRSGHKMIQSEWCRSLGRFVLFGLLVQSCRVSLLRFAQAMLRLS